MFEQCQDVLKHYEEIQAELSRPEVAADQNRFRKLMKEQSDLNDLVDAYRGYLRALADQKDALFMLEEEKDEELRSLLKEELRRLGSLIMLSAEMHRVPAGGALAVDREAFAQTITDAIRRHPNIEIVEREITEFPDGPCIIATGPLTSDGLIPAIAEVCPEEGFLHFYDAAAPLIAFDSIDMKRAWFGSRYNKGTADYINCPMNKNEYEAFVSELSSAQQAAVHGFEDSGVFEGCMPVEVMARRGADTLRYGPMKPVGLRHPETNESFYAVVQLRRDNEEGSVFNLVGFQTHLTFPEQRRVCHRQQKFF